MKESEEKKNVSNRKGWSIVGFLISILLLTIAIVLSMNEEKATREAKINEKMINSEVRESIEQTSSEISKTVNQVKSINSIENEVNNEINATNQISNNEQNKDNEINANEQTNQIAENKINENVQANEVQQPVQNDENIDKETTNEQFIMPIEGEISSGYSIDNLQYSNTLQEWITHRGIDIKADKTTVVKASKSGTVKYIKEDPRYGLSITIEHSDGFQTVYSSLLSSEFVKEGDKVEQGQSIGTVGNSAVFESAEGSHLHFEMLKDGEYVNPDIYLK